MLQVYAQETTFDNKEDGHCRLKRKPKIIYHIQCEKSRQQEVRSKVKQKTKSKTMPKITPREEIVHVRIQKVNVRLGGRADSSVTKNKKGKRKRRLRSPSPTGSPRRIGKVTVKEVMTEMRKAHPISWIKVRQGKDTEHSAQASRELANGEIQVIIGIFANVLNSNPQVDENSETSVRIQTQLNLQRNRAIQHQLRFKFLQMMSESDDKTQHSVRLHLANKLCSQKRKNWDLRWESFQSGSQNRQNPNDPTIEEISAEWTLSMERQGNRLAFFTTACLKIPENRHRFFKPGPVSNVSSFSFTTSNRE